MDTETTVLSEVNKWVNSPIIHIGQTPVTLGGILSALLVFVMACFISGMVQKIVQTKLSKRMKLNSGMSYALSRILHYAIILVGALVAVQCIGLNFGSLAVVFGFLSVGIGFGLQNVTSNFIAGLMLLFERPISVGDFISVDQQVGKVKDIKMRSTIIETLDHVTIVVPNAKFVESAVTNWSFDQPRIRLHCPVGVAYGSDTALVKQTLLGVAANHPQVLKNPAPDVQFLAFGDSSLNFDLLVWMDEPEKQFALRSKINFEIDEAFRKAGIKIPFPQRDLHLQVTPAIEKIAGVK